jgi:preprotein translocase subunit SecY
VFPTTIAGFSDSPWAKTAADLLAPESLLYNLSYVALIIFFCYFYTAVVFNPTDVADNMKKNGGFIPGIRPGQRTAEYLDRILSRVTFGGALYISAVCVLPTLLIGSFNIPFFFGGTALLIVVGVALDTAAQIETQVLMRNYEGFMKRGRIRGRTDRR